MIVVTTEALDALDESIVVWANRVKGISEATDTVTYSEAMEATAQACPLCQRYNPALVFRGSMLCDGCPIQAKTEQPFCEGTPYQQYDEACDEYECHELSVAESRPTAEPAAKAMLMFLEDLRDECSDGRSHE